ncbi:hypothetical protein AgCh_010312 [Apium graveolens]
MEDKSHPQLKQIIEILGKVELVMLVAESKPKSEIYLYDFEKENACVISHILCNVVIWLIPKISELLSGWEGSAHDSKLLNYALSRRNGLEVPQVEDDRSWDTEEADNPELNMSSQQQQRTKANTWRANTANSILKDRPHNVVNEEDGEDQYDDSLVILFFCLLMSWRVGVMAEDGKVKIDKFDDKDYGFWKIQIEDYLYHKKLHELLEEKKPTSMKDEDWKLLDMQALGVVTLNLAKNVAYNIFKEMTTYGLIKALSNMNEKPSASNKVYLIRLLITTRLNEGDCVADYVNEFNSILARLASVDIKFDDEVHALLLASLLPDSWSGFVTIISNSSGSGKMTFDEVRDSILGEDICNIPKSGVRIGCH